MFLGLSNRTFFKLDGAVCGSLVKALQSKKKKFELAVVLLSKAREDVFKVIKKQCVMKHIPVMFWNNDHTPKADRDRTLVRNAASRYRMILTKMGPSSQTNDWRYKRKGVDTVLIYAIHLDKMKNGLSRAGIVWNLDGQTCSKMNGYLLQELESRIQKSVEKLDEDARVKAKVNKYIHGSDFEEDSDEDSEELNASTSIYKMVFEHLEKIQTDQKCDKICLLITAEPGYFDDESESLEVFKNKLLAEAMDMSNMMKVRHPRA